MIWRPFTRRRHTFPADVNVGEMGKHASTGKTAWRKWDETISNALNWRAEGVHAGRHGRGDRALVRGPCGFANAANAAGGGARNAGGIR